MCGYFCIGFIDVLLKGRSLLDYINLFSLKKWKNSEKIILKCFQWIKTLGRKNSSVLFVVSKENLKKPKISYIFEKKKKKKNSSFYYWQ